jgi:hypothetical protein
MLQRGLRAVMAAAIYFAPCTQLSAQDGPVKHSVEGEHLTLKSWTACPTIEHTSHMLVFDGLHVDCEHIKAGQRLIVDRAEQVPARRWMCIDHPHASGPSTSCNWHTFQDEPKTWLCARVASVAGPCKWGPSEYFMREPILGKAP